MALELRNPHSVLAAIAHRPQDVFEVRVHSLSPGKAWDDVVDAAQSYQIPVRRGVVRSNARRSRKRDVSETQSARTGAGEASVREHSGTSLEALFADAKSRENGRGLWLALDCLQDPHNVGAVFRTAAFYNVQGIVLTRDKSAPLNATVYDVACGGLESVPFSVQPNLARALALSKEAGLWCLGTSEHSAQDVAGISRDRPWLLVVGNEEKGLRKLTEQHCDEICRLSPRGEVTSLNVSVATGILIAALSPPV